MRFFSYIVFLKVIIINLHQFLFSGTQEVLKLLFVTMIFMLQYNIYLIL